MTNEVLLVENKLALHQRGAMITIDETRIDECGTFRRDNIMDVTPKTRLKTIAFSIGKLAFDMYSVLASVIYGLSTASQVTARCIQFPTLCSTMSVTSSFSIILQQFKNLEPTPYQ